jgi:hypothetical protein
MIDGEEIFERVEPEWSPGGQKDVPVSFTEKSHKRQYVRELSTGCGKVLASAFSAIRDETGYEMQGSRERQSLGIPSPVHPGMSRLSCFLYRRRVSSV